MFIIFWVWLLVLILFICKIIFKYCLTINCDIITFYFQNTSKRPTKKTKPLSTVDIENELSNSDISLSDDDDSFNSTSSSESDSENNFDEVSSHNDTNIYFN